jgi:hypothetical protein
MAKKQTDNSIVTITPANMVQVTIAIKGTAPFLQLKFSQKGKNAMLDHMATPASEKKGKKARPVRNYAEEFALAQHRSVAGWVGIPCAAFRKAMVDACRTVSVTMTVAKMAIFVVPDGFDVDDGTPLVRLVSPREPERTELPVRNANGSIDIRVRPMWREWSANVTLEYDADMITAESIVNLLDRAGRQVGVGEGRNFSKNSVGQGWGSFIVLEGEAA